MANTKKTNAAGGKAFDKSVRRWANPHKRSKQFCDELKSGVHAVGAKEGAPLSEKERLYRVGYLQAQNDQAGNFVFKDMIARGKSKDEAFAASTQKGFWARLFGKLTNKS